MGDISTADDQIKEIIRKAFQAYDEDCSGFLERPEIRRLFDDACMEFGTPMVSDEHLTNIINEVDDNGDGMFSTEELTELFQPILEKLLG